MVVPSRSRLRRIAIQRQADFERSNMLRIIVKINARTLYNFQAVNISDLADVSDYRVQETVTQTEFVLKSHQRSKGALELARRITDEFEDRIQRRK